MPSSCEDMVTWEVLDALESVSDGAAVMLSAPGLPVLRCTDGFADLVARPRARAASSSFLEYMEPRDRKRVLEELRRALAEDRPVSARFRLKTSQGRTVWVRARGYYTGGAHMLCLCFIDETLLMERERVRSRFEERLMHQATYDSLTGLLNRQATQERADALLSRSDSGAICALADVDDFKLLNDMRGHPFGDRALKCVAREILCSCRPGDVAGRIGGDEFFLLIDGAPDSFDADARLERLLLAVAGIGERMGVPGCVTVSLGAVRASGAADFDALYHRADAALYRAKDRGKNSVAWE